MKGLLRCCVETFISLANQVFFCVCANQSLRSFSCFLVFSCCVAFKSCRPRVLLPPLGLVVVVLFGRCPISFTREIAEDHPGDFP